MTSGCYERADCNTMFELYKGVRGVRPQVTFDITSNSPCVSQGNAR